MKKIALSLFVIALSGAFVAVQSWKSQAEDSLSAAPAGSDEQSGCGQRRDPSAAVVGPTFAIQPASFVTQGPMEFRSSPAPTAAAARSYADGDYTGPAVDAYYGLVQVQAIIQGGRLVGIKVLQYPSDRRTSIRINRSALPMLRDEVISAQSANVDIISGATLTSEAFVRSLAAALRKAAA